MRHITLLFLLCGAIACQGATQTSVQFFAEDFANKEAPTPPTFRLPKVARPIRYRAALTLIPGQDTFEGDLQIDLEFTEKTSVLWLNASFLQIKSAQLKTGDKVRTSPVIVYETPSSKGSLFSARVIEGNDDFVGFDFGREMPPGPATLQISYQGNVAKQDESGIFQQEEEKSWYIFTQFEATDARRAFPCFDEPEYKVPWRLTLRIPGEVAGFANTPVDTETKLLNSKNPLASLREITFQETKPLPSYLISFAVGPFETVEVGKVGKNGIPARIITPKGRKAWAEYAAKHTPEIVQSIEDYMGIAYPYEKLDQIAIPRFSGAMENAGLITYSQGLLLAEPGKDTINRQRYFMLTSAHEIGHHWFGNLVTMLWWDDLWLNEAFAEWIMGRVMIEMRPEWSMAEEVVDESTGAKSADSVLSASKIRHKIESKADINDAFDGGITYAKGQAVLMMFEKSIGPEVFQRGVRRYLQEHSFQSATIFDFLQAMSAEVGRDISPAFNSFIDQPGVPLVSGALTCDKKSPAKLSLSQSRYFTMGAGAPDSSRWEIPVCIRYSAAGVKTKECFVLEKEREDRTLKACPDWLTLNADGGGYYYAGYSKEMLQKLLKDGAASLSVQERIALLSDVRAAVEGGSLLAGEALSLVIPVLKENNRYLVNNIATLFTSYTNKHIITAEQRPNFARAIQKVFGEKAKGLGFTFTAKETEEEKLLHKTLVGLMASYGDDRALQAEASKLASAWLTDQSAVDPEFVVTVLSIAASHGDRALFDSFYEAAKKTQDRRVRDRLLTALGSFTDPEITKASFPLVLGGDFEVRDAMKILWGALGEKATSVLAYQFVTQNFEKILQRLPADGAFRYGAYLPYFGAAFCDAKGKAEVAAFFTERMKTYEGGEQALEEVLEGIDVCITFSAKQRESISSFLKAY